MKDRLKKVSHQMVSSEDYVSDRVIELGSLCIEANEIFSEVCKGNADKLKDLAFKCTEIGVVSDSINFELYLANRVTIEELEKKMNETIENL